MEIKEAHQQKMAAQLKEWSAQIDLFEAKAANAGADIKLKQNQHLQEFRIKQRAAFAQIRELENASDAAWEQVKTTADKVWDDLKAGVADAQSKFQ